MRVLLEEPALHDLRHLATEIYSLVVPTGLPAEEAAHRPYPSAQLDQLLVLELAQTAWRKLRQVGPVYDGFVGYYRALPDYQVEWLTYAAAQQSNQARIVSLLRAEQLPTAVLWLGLQQAQLCAEKEYAETKQACPVVAPAAAPPLLPAARAVPSAVGGARFVTEVWVGNYMVQAFLVACDECGVAIVQKRPSLGYGSVVNDLSYYTISLASANDLFELGRFMVLHQLALQGEQGLQTR
ncbi:MAG: hypothetical protein ACRYFK_07580 [Janthinobacterium lividum]